MLAKSKQISAEVLLMKLQAMRWRFREVAEHHGIKLKVADREVKSAQIKIVQGLGDIERKGLPREIREQKWFKTMERVGDEVRLPKRKRRATA